MPKPYWISYNKKKSCKWCFNLIQLDGCVKCRVHGWERICPPGYLFIRRKTNMLIDELRKKGKKCLHFEGETFVMYQEEQHYK
jgi:hypothetical protein